LGGDRVHLPNLQIHPARVVHSVSSALELKANPQVLHPYLCNLRNLRIVF